MLYRFKLGTVKNQKQADQLVRGVSMVNGVSNIEISIPDSVMLVTSDTEAYHDIQNAIEENGGRLLWK